MNDKPEHKIRFGAVTATIWSRTVEKYGRSFTMRQVTLDRSYKDGEGAWKSTNSYDLNDVPKAIVALARAYQYIMDTPDSEVVVEDIK